MLYKALLSRVGMEWADLQPLKGIFSRGLSGLTLPGIPKKSQQTFGPTAALRMYSLPGPRITPRTLRLRRSETWFFYLETRSLILGKIIPVIPGYCHVMIALKTQCFHFPYTLDTCASNEFSLSFYLLRRAQVFTQ